MTQLILDADGANIVLPESRKGGYTAERQDLAVDVEMVTGRLVREVRGSVWVVRYQYGYFTDEMKNAVISACEKGRRASFKCGFLEPKSLITLTYSKFIVLEFTYPKFMWSRGAQQPDGTWETVPMWGDFSLTLREVAPSD